VQPAAADLGEVFLAGQLLQRSPLLGQLGQQLQRLPCHVRHERVLPRLQCLQARLLSLHERPLLLLALLLLLQLRLPLRQVIR
jgi:hypothetical protein